MPASDPPSAAHPPAVSAQAADPKPRVSLIISTYNWPEALDLVLDSAVRQTFQPMEIIVADDGSRDDTAALIAEWTARSAIPIIHSWQEDEGFRLARSRNLAAQRARGDYLIFLDGDSLVFPTFAENHQRNAAPGWFTVGRRCYVRRWATHRILDQRLRPHRWARAALFPLALFGGSNRPLQLLTLPQSEARRRNRPTEWNKAQGGNLGVWREDLLRVGGFDESYGHYGLEDTDFVVRLFRAGVHRITLEHLDPVLHLWHGRKKTPDANRARLAALLEADAIAPQRSLLLTDGSDGPPQPHRDGGQIHNI